MGTNALRQLLMSLCHDSQWEYAVFWKLNQQTQMFLIWEDGYCSYPKPRQPMECMLENTCFNETSDINSFDCESDTYSGNAVGYHPIGLAVASMSCYLHPLGEGLIGRVASTGKHCWFSSDDLYSNLFPKYLNEWQLQFASGIKTILLVPVVSLGVLQLGSLEMVTEDLKCVAHIRDMFYTPQFVLGASVPFTECWDLPDPLLLSQKSLLGNLAEPPAITSTLSNLIQPVLPVKRDHSELDGIQISKNILSIITPDIESQFLGQDNLQVQERNAGSVWRTEVGDMSEGLTAASFPQGQFSNTCHLEKLSGNVSEFSCQEEESAFAFDTDTNMNLWPSNDMTNLPFGAEINKDIDFDSVFGFLLSAPTDSELQNALGPNFLEMCNEYLRDTNIAGEDVNSSSTLVCHADLTGGLEQSIGNSSGCSIKITAKENLMDEVVFNAYAASGDTPSGNSSGCSIKITAKENLMDEVVFNAYTASGDTPSNHVRSPTTSSGQLAASCQTRSQSGCSVFEVDDLGPWSYKKPAFISKHTEVFGSSPSESSLKSMISTVIDEEHQKKGCGAMQSRRGAKISHLGKRKTRFGDVQRPRPRPRDRQMIQDRVKELRELVPNGAKCSIDSLLDRTVKHMMFLRSVTDQAEKLKQRVNRKVVGRRNWKSSETQTQQNSTSWAFGLGRQLEMCPIVVEDLEHPGHMLIEVLCEEHKLFLEIAQILRNLELTILKGTMENHSDKPWAHFIVEVSSGFDRMDIFWPLMQLLQRSNPIPSMF